jgi:ketosteroid isomerase-like protein
MGQDEKLIAETFTDYVHAFQTLNAQAVFSYCHVPCMFIAPQGVLVMTTVAEVEAFFRRVMEGLKARGYGRSELTDLQVKRMSERAGLVSVGRVRYATDGRELEQLGETYSLRKTDDGWKIAAAMVHDPDAVLKFG